MSENKQRTATQRIEDLETSLVGMYQLTNSMARDINMMKEALQILGKKLDAVVRAVNEGGSIDDKRLSDYIIESNVEQLKATVEGAVSRGEISPAEAISDTSYVVVRQSDASGKVLDPRLQFAIVKIPEEMRPKLVGSKVGDVLELGDSVKTEVLEIYTINPPKDPDAEETKAPEAQA